MEQLGRSLIKTNKSKGPRTDPCGTPLITLSTVEIVRLLPVFEVANQQIQTCSSDSQKRVLFYQSFVVHFVECLFEINIKIHEEIAAGRINVDEKVV